MSVENSMAKAQTQDQKILASRESIRRSFPDEPYEGIITCCDEYLNDPEFDEEKELFDTLNGHKWSEVSTRFLLTQPFGYEVLTEQAYRAFLAAWLMYAIEDVNAENEVRNYLAISFGQTMHKFRVLNADQQQTVRSLMVEFAERGLSPSYREDALQTIVYIDRKRY